MPDSSSDSSQPVDADEVPEEYRVSRGERPERIRRRNLITGIALVIFIAAVIGATVYSRATSEEASSYGIDNPVDRPNQKTKGKKGQPEIRR
jgi:hypothetical protein